MEAIDTAAVSRPGAFLGQISSRVRSAAAGICRQETTTRILDVGCGNGLLFAEAGGTENRFHGVDADFQLLAESRQILQDNNVAPARVALGDAGHLPYRDASFGLVMLLNTLINIPTDALVRQFVGELVRITIPGGRVVVDIRNANNLALRLRYRTNNRSADFTTRAYRLSDICDLLGSLGCTVDDTHRIGPWMPFGCSGIVVVARKSD